MTTRESIEAVIAALSTIENARPDIHFTYSGSPKAYTQDVWTAIHTLGGTLKVTLYYGGDMAPHIIESMSYSVGNVTVGVQRDREPTDEEMAMISTVEATAHADVYKSVPIIGQRS